MSRIKAIIFDMDGVLIDAKEWHYDALNQALEFYGYPAISRNQHLEIYNGLPTKEKLAKYGPTADLSSEEKQIINDKKQEFTSVAVETSCKPFQLHHEALETLQGEGYKLAVCSNSIRASVESMLGKADLLKFFEFFMSNQDVTRPKPHPDIYVDAIARLGLKPDEVLVCEDNIRGITSAMHSGAYILEIGTVEDVNYKNIKQALDLIESGQARQLVRPSVRTARLADMAGGWFVGNFFPNILRSKNFEVAVKSYQKGDIEPWHFHKVGTEITLVLDGAVKMRDMTFKAGDIILLEPGEGTAFEALSDTRTVVVKTPSAPDDKFFEVDEV